MLGLGCTRFIDSYRFLSSSVHSLVKTLVDENHKTLKNLKDEIVDKNDILNIVNRCRSHEIGVEKRIIKDLKKGSPQKI